MYHFCTYFDSNYLLRGITLYRSLAKHCKKPFRFYALCLDEDAFSALTKLGEGISSPSSKTSSSGITSFWRPKRIAAGSSIILP